MHRKTANFGIKLLYFILTAIMIHTVNPLFLKAAEINEIGVVFFLRNSNAIGSIQTCPWKEPPLARPQIFYWPFLVNSSTLIQLQTAQGFKKISFYDLKPGDKIRIVAAPSTPNPREYARYKIAQAVWVERDFPLPANLPEASNPRTPYVESLVEYSSQPKDQIGILEVARHERIGETQEYRKCGSYWFVVTNNTVIVANNAHGSFVPAKFDSLGGKIDVRYKPVTASAQVFKPTKFLVRNTARSSDGRVYVRELSRPQPNRTFVADELVILGRN